ncbi:unnamed protein product [Soboliphyme baturini]|uniref:SH3 domain-containing protein n=1 Tax=Soboliphyme baturini TaxID=241478 RepID=A0A183IEH1_9BILA|nr:unnamed protein product [Soboliphyme baturini]
MFNFSYPEEPAFAIVSSQRRLPERTTQTIGWISDVLQRRNQGSGDSCQFGCLDRSQLSGATDYANGSGTNQMLDFKVEVLSRTIDDYQTTAAELDTKQSLLPSVPFNADPDFKANLKNREDGLQAMRELGKAHSKIKNYIEDFEENLHKQNKLIALLEHAGLFYQTQLSEAEFVETAYRKFGSGINAVRSDVEALEKSEPFLTVSPPQDAPSPSPLDDPFPLGVEAVIAAPELDREEPETLLYIRRQVIANSFLQSSQLHAKQETLVGGKIRKIKARIDTPDCRLNPVSDSFSSATGAMVSEAPVDPFAIAGANTDASLIHLSSLDSRDGGFVANYDPQQRPPPLLMHMQRSEALRQMPTLFSSPCVRPLPPPPPPPYFANSVISPLTNAFSTPDPVDPAVVPSSIDMAYCPPAFGHGDFDMRRMMPSAVEPLAPPSMSSPSSPLLASQEWSTTMWQPMARPARIAGLLPKTFPLVDDEFVNMRCSRRERTLLSTPCASPSSNLHNHEGIPQPIRTSSRPALLPVEPNGHTSTQPDRVADDNNDVMESFPY